MRRVNRLFSSALMAAALALSVIITGCAVHAGYRVYDPYYTDYHRWGPGEDVYYNRWVVETHRERRDFRRLKHEEQREYWNWRHSHRDHH